MNIIHLEIRQFYIDEGLGRDISSQALDGVYTKGEKGEHIGFLSTCHSFWCCKRVLSDIPSPYYICICIEMYHTYH